MLFAEVAVFCLCSFFLDALKETDFPVRLLLLRFSELLLAEERRSIVGGGGGGGAGGLEFRRLGDFRGVWLLVVLS